MSQSSLRAFAYVSRRPTTVRAARGPELRAFAVAALAFLSALGVSVLGVAQAARAEEPAASASADPVFALPEGAAIPPVSAADQTGALRDFASLTGEAGLVLYFVRSVDWCPICKGQVAGIEERLSDFEARGYRVAVATTDTPDLLADYVARSGSRLAFLADRERALVTSFNVADPAFLEPHKSPDHKFYALPFPAAFVITPDGVVKAALFAAEAYGDQKGYRARITVDDVIAAIDAES